MRRFEPLIFERLRVEADQLSISAKDWQGRPYENFEIPGAPDKAVQTESKARICRLFPTESKRDTAAGSPCIEFSEYGSWNLKGSFGARKILLIDPDASQYEVIRCVARFITDNSWHSGNDHYLVNSNQEIDLWPLVEKLHYSDQPLGLHCGPIAKLTAYVLMQFGMSCRLVGIKGKGQAHIFIETLLQDEQNWIIVDTDFGVIPKLGGSAASLSMIHACLNMGNEESISLDEFSARRATLPKFHFPTTSTGQISWKPEFMRTLKMASKERLVNLYRSAQQELWTRDLILKETQQGKVLQAFRKI